MNVTLLALSAIILPAASYAAGGITPAPPTSLAAAADETGLLKATVTLVAPSTDTDGSPLQTLDKIELKREGKTIKTFDNVTPGETCKYTDTSLINGYTSYSAIAYAGDAASEETKSGAIFVGVDVPLAPAQLNTAVDRNKISFTWQKSSKKGENGERVLPDAVIYILDALDDAYEYKQQIAETKGQAYDYFCDVTTGEQDIRRFGIRASNVSGLSDYTYARVIVGAPYYFPYRESFAGGTARDLSWQEGNGSFVMVTDVAADGDSGSIRCTPASDGSVSSFNLGKIAMNQTLNPRMTFRMKGLAEGETLLVNFARYDGAEATLLKITGPVEDWTLFTADLSRMKNESFLIPKFQFAKGNKETIYIDDISFDDPYTHDLAVRVIAPETASGKTEVSVEITNTGLEPADNAFIRILTDGVQTGSLQLAETILPGEIKTLPAEVEITGTESVEIKAILSWIYDLNPVNDTASAQIIPGEPVSNPGSAAISDIREAIGNGSAVYTIDGRKLSATDADTLPRGVYIVNGKKIIVK